MCVAVATLIVMLGGIGGVAHAATAAITALAKKAGDKFSPVTCTEGAIHKRIMQIKTNTRKPGYVHLFVQCGHLSQPTMLLLLNIVCITNVGIDV